MIVLVFRSKHIGSDGLDFIKLWFIEPLNKTGCRFVIVDAYNTLSTMAFYEKNGFKVVFSAELPVVTFSDDALVI